MAEITNRDEVIDEVQKRLADGQSLSRICADAHMPNASTIWRWMQASDDMGARMREAREIGYVLRAERILDEVRACEDPIKARAILAAEQWFLGKLSIGLAERPVGTGPVSADPAGFDAIASALEQLAAAKSSGRSGTRTLAIDGPTGSTDAEP